MTNRRGILGVFPEVRKQAALLRLVKHEGACRLDVNPPVRLFYFSKVLRRTAKTLLDFFVLFYQEKSTNKTFP